MSSPYGVPLSNNESNRGSSAQRQPPRFPPLDAPPAVPPFLAGQGQTPPDSGQTIVPTAPVGSGWGDGNETYFLPPQFSYNPDQQQVVVPPPPVKKSRKGLILGASGAAVVIAAAAVTVGVLVLGKSSDKPGTTAGPTPGQLASDSRTAQRANAVPVWTVNAAQDQNATTTLSSWLVDNRTVVRGDATGLQGYDVQTGKALWTFKVPDPGGVVCGMGRVAAGKIGTIQYGPNKDACNVAVGIDTGTGGAAWRQPIPGTGTATMASDGDVVTGVAGTMLTVWNAADGKKLWDVDLAKANPPARLLQANVNAGHVGLLVDNGKGPTLLMKDSHTGADQWQAVLPPDGLAGAHVTLVSAAAPTLVHVESPANAPTPFDRYYTYDDKGTALPPFDGVGPWGALELREGPAAHQHQIAHVVGTTLIAPTTKDPVTGKQPPNSLVAIDLTTGKPQWQAPLSSGWPLAVAALDQNRVVAFTIGDKTNGAKLLAFAVNGGKPVATGVTAPLGADWSTTRASAYVAGNRLVLVPNGVEKGLAVVAFELKSS